MCAYNVGDQAYILYKVGDSGIINVDYATVEKVAMDGYYHFRIENKETRAATYHKAGMYEIIAVFDNKKDAIDAQINTYKNILCDLNTGVQVLTDEYNKLCCQITSKRALMMQITDILLELSH